MLYNENRELNDEQKRRVLKKAADRDVVCTGCGSRDFRVGKALDMSFLFLDEEQGAYMVALTCKQPDCKSPLTGIRLDEPEFLGDGSRTRDV